MGKGLRQGHGLKQRSSRDAEMVGGVHVGAEIQCGAAGSESAGDSATTGAATTPYEYRDSVVIYQDAWGRRATPLAVCRMACCSRHDTLSLVRCRSTVALLLVMLRSACGDGQWRLGFDCVVERSARSPNTRYPVYLQWLFQHELPCIACT